MAGIGAVIDKKLKWMQLERDIKSIAAGSYTEVGYQGTKKEKNSDVTVVEVAIVQEFGTEDGAIPSRSFVRSYYDSNVKEITKFCKKSLNAMLSGRMTAKGALGLVGEYVKSGIQKQIDKIFFPPLKDATIKKKGSSKPLIDTGTMRASVTHTERMKGQRNG